MFPYALLCYPSKGMWKKDVGMSPIQIFEWIEFYVSTANRILIKISVKRLVLEDWRHSLHSNAKYVKES